MPSDKRFPYKTMGVPEHLREGLARYVDEGVAPGGFLCAVLANDLQGAVARADDLSFARLREICAWVHEHAPAQSVGSREKLSAWVAHHQARAREVRHG